MTRPQIAAMASRHRRLREGSRMRALLRALRERLKPTRQSHPTGSFARAARIELIKDLRAALDNREFTLEYQPIVHLETGVPVGAEALLRWDRPGFGRTPPASFIPVLEDVGLMREVEASLIGHACRDAVTWPGNLHVAVNLSARRLGSSDLENAVAAALEQSSLPPQRLMLELTETAVPTTDAPAAVEQLHALARLGVRLALDDFGTGTSSLTQLRDFPVDTIKIDRTFIAGLGRSAEDTAIVATLLRLAQDLGVTVVAEGVEKQAQAVTLRNLGCPLAQGYLWSRPVPAELIKDTFQALTRAGPH